MKIAALIDTQDRLRFFSRLESAPKVDEVTYLSIFQPKLRESNTYKFHVVKFTTLMYILIGIPKCIRFINLEKCLESHSKNRIQSFIRFLLGWALTKQHLNLSDCKLMLIWNGTKSFSRGCAAASRDAGVRIRFVELGNVPNKLFVDDKGTNADSSIYFNPSLIRSRNLVEPDTKDWLEHYKRILNEQIVPPQLNLENKARNKSLNLKKLRPIDKLKKSKASSFYDFSDEKFFGKLPEKYVFVPLQVSNDSQLLINSDISLIDFVKRVIQEARDSNEIYVIKFHPCDTQHSVVSILKLLNGATDIIVNQGSSIKLIEGSSRVITINSTVGLEALLLGKEVEFCGRTFFESFDRDKALGYVIDYLIDVSYFDDRTFTEEEVNALLGY